MSRILARKAQQARNRNRGGRGVAARVAEQFGKVSGTTWFGGAPAASGSPT